MLDTLAKLISVVESLVESHNRAITLDQNKDVFGQLIQRTSVKWKTRQQGGDDTQSRY